MNENSKKHEDAIFEKDRSEFQTFMESQHNAATRRRKIQQIAYFYEWLKIKNHEIKSILDVDPLIFRDYFQYIEKSVDAQFSIKSKYRSVLKQFILWIMVPKLARGEKSRFDYSIVFAPNYVELTDSGFTRTVEPLSKNDILDCINFFRTRNERDYIVVCLLAYTGMRIGGLVNIEIKNIDFTTRCINTKEKRTKANTGDNRYAFPKFFAESLKAYVFQYQLMRPNEIYLFPVTTKNLRQQLKKWRKEIHPHLFRDALNSRWADLGMDEGLRSIILNQKPTGVNAQHYLKELKSWNKRLEYYDRFFPY